MPDRLPHPPTNQLLHLLQLASPALPVGAFSYSEGLETLVQNGQLPSADDLQQWLTDELAHGAVRIEAAIALRALRCAREQNWAGLQYWNQWLSAFRETEEMRIQSWHTGRSLVRLLRELIPDCAAHLDALGDQCNFAIAFSAAAAYWRLTEAEAIAAYLHSWASNLVNAGVKLIPLGQTQGQLVLLALHPVIQETVNTALILQDDELYCCNWGLAIASMNHEVLYSRLFRS
jgi:urease accessory protein